MRYKLDETTGKHPWRKRRNPYNGTLEPAYQALRGIRDTETGEWHTEPATRRQLHYVLVREANGLPQLSRQKVQAALKTRGIQFSETHTTRVRGWHNTTGGVKVWESDTGVINVGYNVSHWTKDPDFPALLAPAFKALQQAGLNPTQRDDGLITL